MRLDPRVALVSAIVLNLVAVAPGPEVICWLIFTLTLIPLLANRRFAWATGYAAAFIILRGASLALSHSHDRLLVALAGGGLFASRYLLPIGVALALYATVTVGEVIAALRWARTPETIVIPVAVMFRMLPAVAEEIRAVWEAHLLRGALGRARRPLLQRVEDVLAPVLVNTLRMSDVLTAAALVRGLGSGRPTSATRLVPHVRDMCALVATMGVLVGWAVLR